MIPTPLPAPVLDVAGLHAGYGPIQVLRGADIRIAPGEIVGVTGLNGAGKTTLLRALSGVIPRTCERAVSAGRSLPTRPEDVARAGISHVPEGRQVFRQLGVPDNLRYGAAAVARPEAGVLDSVLEAFPRLKELSGRRAGQLSGGEQQMLAIARGLMASPRLLMVDELSLGLSPRAALDITTALAAVAGAATGLALLLVDQNTQLLAEVCDRGYVIADGVAEPVADINSAESAYF